MRILIRDPGILLTLDLDLGVFKTLDPGSGMEKILIWDKYPGSAILLPCYFCHCVCRVLMCRIIIYEQEKLSRPLIMFSCTSLLSTINQSVMVLIIKLCPGVGEPGPDGEHGPVNVADFAAHVASLHADSDIGFSREYNEILRSVQSISQSRASIRSQSVRLALQSIRSISRLCGPRGQPPCWQRHWLQSRVQWDPEVSAINQSG